MFIHIGLPKTGTTFLQTRLWHHRQQLARNGLLYPGKRPGAHFHATLDLHHTGFAGNKIPESKGALRELLDEIAAFDGRAIISHELLAASTPAQIKQLVDRLAPRQAHVIVTVRDLSQIIPATWQERAKNQTIERWGEFVEKVSAGAASGHPFWELQDLPTILGRWSECVPAERVHVITVPQRNDAGPSLLDRFASVIDISPRAIEDVPRAQSNQSMGALQVVLLQRINAAAEERRLTWDEYHRQVKAMLANRYLSQRPDRRRVSLDESQRSWVEEATQDAVAAITSSRCQVVGDLADLKPTGFSVVPIEPPESATDEELLQEAAELTLDLTAGMIQMRDVAERRLLRIHTLERKLEAAQRKVSRYAGLSNTARMKRKLVDFAENNRAAGVALEWWRSRRRARPT